MSGELVFPRYNAAWADIDANEPGASSIGEAKIAPVHQGSLDRPLICMLDPPAE